MLSQRDLEVFYNEYMNKACHAAISKLQGLLSSGEKKDTFEAIDILKRIQKDCGDINNIILQLLPFANLIFCTFVRTYSKDFINTLEVYDILFISMKPEHIIKLLESKVIEPEHSMIINKIDTMSSILYLIIQNCKYDTSIKEYLLKKYNNYITDEGVFRHIILYNIPNDIVLYLKTCVDTDNFNENYVSFKSALNYYKFVEHKFNNKDLFASRLHNVIQMIINIKIEKGYNFPQQDEFVQNFKKYYSVSEPIKLHYFMDILPYDAHLYITTEYMIQYTKKIFPIQSDTWY